MSQRLFNYKTSTISYYRSGSGPRTIFCLHGYGQTGRQFAFLSTGGAGFTFIALDLPFHGETAWLGEGMNAADLVAILEGIAEEERLNFPISLLGYSLGGRVVLSLYQQAPEKFDRLLLLAPDGLKLNGWYWLATQTWAGKRLFRFTMRHPAWFFAILRAFNRLGFVNASVYKFVANYIGNAAMRDQLFTRWISLRRLRPDLSDIRKSIRADQIPVRILYGKYDRIILTSPGERFLDGLGESCSLRILDGGHQLLTEKHKDEILRSLHD